MKKKPEVDKRYHSAKRGAAQTVKGQNFGLGRVWGGHERGQPVGLEKIMANHRALKKGEAVIHHRLQCR